jgi:ribonuclease D
MFQTDSRIAWDIETSGLDWQADRIGTCQLHSKIFGTVIVVTRESRPENLMRLLEDVSTLKVFHHAPFDMRFMAAQWQGPINNVACTKVASRLLSPSLPTAEHSLKPLLRRFLGIEISKAEQMSDWLAAELTPEQLAYAAGDVEYLLPLFDRLVSEVGNSGLSQLYQNCCSFLPTRVALELGGWPDVFAY